MLLESHGWENSAELGVTLGTPMGALGGVVVAWIVDSDSRDDVAIGNATTRRDEGTPGAAGRLRHTLTTFTALATAALLVIAVLELRSGRLQGSQSTTTTTTSAAKPPPKIPSGFVGSWGDVREVSSAGKAFAGVFPIACGSPTFCMAVLDTWSSQRQLDGELTYIWNGVRWVSTATLHIALSWLSCVSVRWCIGGGSSNETAIWHHGKWSLWSSEAWLQVQTVNGDCVSPSFCMAGEADGVLAEWDGSGWNATSVFDTPRSGDSSAPLVACSNRLFCIARQTPAIPADPGPDTYSVWNGTTWSSPRIVEDRSKDAYQLSCGAPTLCVAIADYPTPNEAGQTVASRWDGRSWVEQPLGPEGDGMVNPESVACVGPKFCVALLDTPGAYEFLGSSWRSSDLNFPYGTQPWITCSPPYWCVASWGGKDAVVFKLPRSVAAALG